MLMGANFLRRNEGELDFNSDSLGLMAINPDLLSSSDNDSAAALAFVAAAYKKKIEGRKRWFDIGASKTLSKVQRRIYIERRGNLSHRKKVERKKSRKIYLQVNAPRETTVQNPSMV